MGKFLSMQFAIILRNSNGQTINGTASMYDLAKTRTLAQSILRLMPEAFCCDLHPATNHWQYQTEAKETVYREEKEGTR